MNWLIDCGNTRIKWARADARAILESGSILHAGRRVEAIDELAGRVRSVPGGDGGSAWVASVLDKKFTDAIVAALRGFVADVRSVEPRATAFGVTAGYTELEKLGVDRWLAMVAAYDRAAGAVCVVNAGTAVTFDAIDSRGAHLGGFIWPGRRMMASALAERTERIGPTGPMLGADPSQSPLGRTTDAAVANGSVIAIAAAVDRAVKIAAAAALEQPLLILGGGDAGLVRPWLESRAEIRHDIVLEGLRIVAAAPG